MKLKVNLGSYITQEYSNIGQKRVQLISNKRVCTMEEVDKYFGEVFEEYAKREKTNKIKSKVLSIKDKLCQIMKKK